MFEWANDDSRLFMSRGYLLDGETVESRTRDIAEAAQALLPKNPGFAEKFYRYMGSGYYSLSSPVWANFGRKRGLPISCNNSYFGDSIEEILYGVAEIGTMTKHGAGTSAYLGDIRKRGSEISSGGKSDGPVHFASMIETTIDVISQGNVRRGNAAIYLDVDHPDIAEFLDVREEGSPIQKLSIGVCISDDWMESMISGDAEKRSIWARIIRKRFETGYPYIVFSDTVNRNAPEVYRDKNRRINGSNLCVAGDTMVLTVDGHERIDTLAGSTKKVWNGEQWSNATFAKTGENKTLYRVVTSDGSYLDCTDEHHWYVVPGYSKSPVKVATKNLNVGDKLIKFDLPVIEGDLELDRAYTNGFFTGDGCHYEGKNILYLYDEKKSLADFIEADTDWNVSGPNRLIAYARGLEDKFFVPGADYTIKSRLDWFAGLLDADGTVAYAEGCNMIQLGSVNLDFLRDIKMMLQTLGIRSYISTMAEAGHREMPANDGTGSTKPFYCQKTYRLMLSSVQTSKVLQLGLKCNRLGLSYKDHQRESARFVTVSEIVELDGLHDTYCFNEPIRHMGVFNGILTGQCSEIALSSNDDESFVCNLASMNLLTYDEWENTDAVETLVAFLDAVMTEYIDKIAGVKFMERAHRFAVNQRAIGIGTLGYHSYLQSKMIPFESMEAKLANSLIHKTIAERALTASKHLAELYGEPTMLEGYGRRNVTLMAIAPTTSSSFILGQVSPSVEPLASNYFTKDLAKGKFTYKNPYLVEVLVSHGRNDAATWRSILEKGGSVQHLDFLTDHERKVFKTFGEISQLEIVQQAAARQKFVDQSQSINLMIHPDTPLKDVNSLLIEAWRSGVKSLYYQRGTNPAQELALNLNACVACEA